MPTSTTSVDEALAAVPQPWEQLPEESPRAYAAFSRYRGLIPELRSIRRAAELSFEEATGKRRGTVDSVERQFEKWSSSHFWSARAQLHDQFLTRVQYEAEIVARQEMGRAHAEAADSILAKGVEALVGVKTEEMSVSDIARYIELGIKLGRIARGADVPDDGSPAMSEERPQDMVRRFYTTDAEVTKAAARLGAQVVRAQREAEEDQEG